MEAKKSILCGDYTSDYELCPNLPLAPIPADHTPDDLDIKAIWYGPVDTWETSLNPYTKSGVLILLLIGLPHPYVV